MKIKSSDKESKEKEKNNKKTPIRFGFGIMSIDSILSSEYLQYYLKFEDPVIFMHKSDFENLLTFPENFTEFRDNYFDMARVLFKWRL